MRFSLFEDSEMIRAATKVIFYNLLFSPEAWIEHPLLL